MYKIIWSTYQLPNSIQYEIHNLLSNGVVTTSIVVCSIFFASDELFRMEQLTVCTSTHLIWKIKLVTLLKFVNKLKAYDCYTRTKSHYDKYLDDQWILTLSMQGFGWLLKMSGHLVTFSQSMMPNLWLPYTTQCYGLKTLIYFQTILQKKSFTSYKLPFTCIFFIVSYVCFHHCKMQIWFFLYEQFHDVLQMVCCTATMASLLVKLLVNVICSSSETFYLNEGCISRSLWHHNGYMILLDAWVDVLGEEKLSII